MSVEYLESLVDASRFPVSSKLQLSRNANFFQNPETQYIETARLSQTGTTITKTDSPYVEFNYYYFEKSKPNKLSGVL